jgi:hypothetical protein
MSATNVRIRGKIRHEEWPKIAERFQRGETLAAIARSYGCTPPAIRYIVTRALGNAMKQPRRAAAQSDIERNPVVRGGERPGQSLLHDLAASRLSDNQIWGRINNDIATFLAAMDALSSSESDSNYENLLRATDRLLWASARTRLEVERVLTNRGASGARKRRSA